MMSFGVGGFRVSMQKRNTGVEFSYSWFLWKVVSEYKSPLCHSAGIQTSLRELLKEGSWQNMFKIFLAVSVSRVMLSWVEAF